MMDITWQFINHIIPFGGNRLNKISNQLDFVEVQKVGPFEEIEESVEDESSDVLDILDRLESGETSAKEALEILKSRKNNK